MERKSFIQSIFGAGALLSIPFCTNPIDTEEINLQIKNISKKCNGSMIGFRAEPISKVKIGLIGIGNRGKTLIQMLDLLLEEQKAEVVALGDLDKKLMAKRPILIMIFIIF